MLISNLYPPKGLGGYEIAAFDLASGLSLRGHEVRVLTSPMDQVQPASAGDVHRVLGLKTHGPTPDTTLSVARFLHYEAAVSQVDNSLILRQQLREFEPDHVMVFNLVGLGGIGLIDVLRRTQTSWSMNLGDTVPLGLTAGIDPGVLDVFGVDPLNYFNDVPFISVSSTLTDEIESSGVRLSRDLLFIPRGIDLTGVTHARRPDDGITRFVFVGSLHENKGVGLLLEAVAMAREHYPRFQVDVFGRGEDAKYKTLANQLGLDGIVFFHGFVDRQRILAALSAADAFLFPTSEREPLGQAPLQAAAMGCVPVLTEQSGAAEWLSDGAHCIKIRRTAEALATAMISILSGETDVAALGHRAQRYMSRSLSYDRYLDAVEAFIERLSSRPAISSAPAISAGADEIVALDARAQTVLHTVLRTEGNP